MNPTITKGIPRFDPVPSGPGFQPSDDQSIMVHYQTPFYPAKSGKIGIVQIVAAAQAQVTLEESSSSLCRHPASPRTQAT